MNKTELLNKKSESKNYKPVSDKELRKFNAHALKSDFISKNDSISKYNIVTQKEGKTENLFLVPRLKTPKAYSMVIPTGLTLEEAKEYYPSERY